MTDSLPFAPQSPSGPGDTPLEVLLIEDNPGDARLFEEYVTESPTQATIRHEQSVEAGLQALKAACPDVLVTDLGLPDSEGAETVKTVAAAAPEVPIVVLTGQEDLQAALEAQKAGATEYLQKSELGPALVGRTLRWAAQRHRLQAKLRQRDAWIRSITEGLSAGVFRTGPTGRIEYANEALAEMLGVEHADDLVGLDLTDFYANPRQQGPTMAEGGTSEVEVEFEAQDGSTFVGLLNAEAAYNPEGKPVHFDGVITDITERVHRKRRLRTLSEAVEQAKESVIITEATSEGKSAPRIEYVNSAFEEMTGYSQEEMIGETPRLLQGPETDREVVDSLRSALEAGEEWEGETINYRKDGTSYRVQWNLAPVRGDNGDIEHWVSVQRDVTEERQREKRLRLLARALEQVGDKVLITNREGQIEYVNEAFEKITGYAEEDVLGKTPKIVQSGEMGDEFYEELWDTLLSGETLQAEFTNERKDGTRYVEDERISPITDENDHITHFVSAGRDVTEKRRRERMLERQNDLFEKAQNIASVGGWEYDLQADEGVLTSQALRIHGLPPDAEMSPERGLTFYHPEDQPTIRKAFLRAIEERKPYDLEARLITANHDQRWVRTRGEPQVKDGEVTHIRGTIQDITERKHREEALREERDRRTALFENASTPIMEIRFEGQTPIIRDVNPAFEATFGIEDKEVPGISVSEAIVPDPQQEGHKHIRDRVFHGERVETEVRRKTVTGLRDFLIQVIPMSVEGHSKGAYAWYTDITERKEREQKLREAKEKAERMNQLKSAFLANMSHEIRTPLTSILGFSEAIAEEVGEARDTGEVDLSTLNQFSSLIERSGRRLMDTLTSVLNLSKLQAGEMTLDLEPIDLATEAREAAEEFGPQATKADVEVTVQADEAWASADEGGVQIVLRNLLSNAIKYTADEGQVWIRSRQEDEMAVLEVEDTGIGMDPAEAKGLFEAFKQASEGVDREYEGTGLGLTVTKEVLNQMGGSIEVDTAKGEGSRFTVRLPRAEAEPSTARANDNDRPTDNPTR